MIRFDDGEKGTEQAGDMTMRDERTLTTQPLSARERGLLRRGYELFDFFSDRLREEHEQMRQARMMRQRKQMERSLTAPGSNTLNSCLLYTSPSPRD